MDEPTRAQQEQVARELMGWEWTPPGAPPEWDSPLVLWPLDTYLREQEWNVEPDGHGRWEYWRDAPVLIADTRAEAVWAAAIVVIGEGAAGRAEGDQLIGEQAVELDALRRQLVERDEQVADLRRRVAMSDAFDLAATRSFGPLVDPPDDAAMLAQQARDDACTDCGAPPDQCRCGPVREG